jgi:DNA-directed RNA polymerase specialized sigma54-like protein
MALVENRALANLQAVCGGAEPEQHTIGVRAPDVVIRTVKSTWVVLIAAVSTPRLRSADNTAGST